MISIYDITLLVYNLALLPVIFFSVLFIVLSILSLFIDKEKPKKYKKFKELPFVSVQIPSFNDPIAERCIKKCMEFDYPKDKFEIVIVDDSTNKETQILLSNISKDNPGFVKYIHRTNREGFKPGALRNAMPITKGEIIVIFDADWIPEKDFLSKVVKPFSDPNVAIVQTRQGFYNHRTNLISRFAMYLLTAYHAVVMPINHRSNSVFFCGTAGAIRKKVMLSVGGWNQFSITEDTELSVRILEKGYKTHYIPIETPSEVPDTFESFIKQQMRWCYGNTRVFMDNWRKILFKSGLKFKQRIMIIYITMGNMAAPMVVLMTLFGLSGWFLGEIKLLEMSDVVTMIARILYTSGFLFMALIALSKKKLANEFGYVVLSAMTIGVIMAFSNSYAFFKAVFNSKLHWFCTPKIDNALFEK